MKKTLSWLALGLFTAPASVAVVVACGTDTNGFGGSSSTGGLPTTVPTEVMTMMPPPSLVNDASTTADTAPPTETRDPETCDEAKTTKSYVGCDYWPTVTPNNVWSIFDYAVVVSNVGKTEADVTVTGPGGVNKTVKVAPGALEKIYLPWVTALKGKDFDRCTGATPLDASNIVPGGAYHLVSSTPVIVYQFNALEYKGQGGPPGKSWASCPANKPKDPVCRGQDPLDCFSFSNDASLLLPSTAMTPNYRITGVAGWTASSLLESVPVMGSYLVVTATEDDTVVTATFSSKVSLLGGGGIVAKRGAGPTKFTLSKAGDVALLVGEKGEAFDFSGSLVQGTKPIQVISGIPCVNVPGNVAACDHVEETVLPAETMGKAYLVTAPTRPADGVGLHVVRFYGGQNSTTLTYQPAAAPTGCPKSLQPGEVATCGPVDKDFFVTGTKEFAIGSFMVGAQLYGTQAGDPSQSNIASVEQYRKTYLFLAPDDYDVSYAVIAGPADAAPVVDGTPVAGAKFVGTGYAVWRVKLGAGNKGAHTLTAGKAVGLQVMGYGDNTSYQYPGGLNLNIISEPPPVPK
jgi:IgGFc binding protein